METNVKKRVAIWDNLKFLLIFLVVFGHFIDHFTSYSSSMRLAFFYIYIFHMPLFIFISGLFSKKTIDNKNYKRLFEYFVLFFIAIIIRFLNQLIFYQNPNVNILSVDQSPWFMFALVAFNYITMYTSKLDKKYALIISIILALLVGYDKNISDYLILSRIIVFYPFFLVGYYLNPKKVVVFVKKRYIQIFSIIFLVGSFIILYYYLDSIYQFRPLITGRNPYYRLGEYHLYGGIFRFLYYLIVPLFMMSIISLMPSQESIFTKFGTRSLNVYILHHVFITIFLKLLNGENFLNKTSYLLLIPITFILTVFLSLKIFDRIIDFLKTVRYNESKSSD